MRAGSFSVAAIAVSLLIAIAAGLEAIFGFGNVWREKRAAAELIKTEGFRYFQLTGPYLGKDHAGAFPDFADAVEQLIAREIRDYLVAVTPRTDASPDEKTTGRTKTTQ